MAVPNQFAQVRFARGVRLTRQHATDTLNEIRVAVATGGGGARFTVEDSGANRLLWEIPWTGAGATESDGVVAWLPWLCPPFQQDFDRATLEEPDYRVRLAELCLSFDQRGEPYAVVGRRSDSAAGTLTAADMTRYDVVLRLKERTPSLGVAGADTTTARELLRVDVSGVDVFGSGAAGAAIERLNPLVMPDLDVALKPFHVYFWQVDCPGLFASAGTIMNQWECTVGGAPVAGDTARLTIGVTNYDYVFLLGDTFVTVAAAVAALAVADPAYEVTSAGAVVVLVGRTPVPGVVPASSWLAGAGTFFAVNTVAGAVGTVEQLALPSLCLSGVLMSPLVQRDRSSDFAGWNVQNIPTTHNGTRTGAVVPLTIPAADALITGTDIQDGILHGFDAELRRRGAHGYGADFGALGNPMQAADVPPRATLIRDSHMAVIVVPLWGGQKFESIRSVDVEEAALPHLSAPWTQLTVDQRVVPVPEGFVLHHAFAVWGGYSARTPSTYTKHRAAYGTWPTSATYVQEVGVILDSGLRSDNRDVQQVAFLRFTPAGGAAPYTNFLVDEYLETFFTGLPGTPVYRILQIPLVHPVAPLWSANSWYQSGLPFFMGKSNTRTTARANCGALPSAFGGGAYAAPVTGGRENVLVVRWGKRDAVNGLNALGATTSVVVGTGGEWVILVGKQSVTG